MVIVPPGYRFLDGVTVSTGFLRRKRIMDQRSVIKIIGGAAVQRAASKNLRMTSLATERKVLAVTS